MMVSWREDGSGFGDVSPEDPEILHTTAILSAKVFWAFNRYPFYFMLDGLRQHQRPEVQVVHKGSDYVETSSSQFVSFQDISA